MFVINPFSWFIQYQNMMYKIIQFKLVGFLVNSLFFFFSPSVINSQYVPPLGIPAPEFGIEESHMMYTTAQYDFGNGLEAYKDSGNGPYTHYVDKTDASATDTNNPYGTPEKPRLTIPQNLEAGSVVEVHNGPYDYFQSIHGGTYLPLVNVNGTAQKPVFIRGTDSTNMFEIGGNRQALVRYATYLILENVLINGPGIMIYQPTNHFVLRHSEITGENSTGISIWTWKTQYTVGELKENIVIYDNLIHDNGPYPSTVETGNHGMIVDNATENLWVVNNTFYENGDDGIHVIDRYWVSELSEAPRANRLFIAGNLMHNDGENAIDVKGSSNVILAQNEVYGYARIMTSSFGDAIRIDDEGDQENIWVIFNHIYDSEWGINPLQSLFPPYIIGNIIHEIKQDENEYFIL